MSYCELFKLTEQPFRLTPDPDFLFASKQHARAKAYMESTIWLADGFVVITGDIGAGKTTLIESFLAEIPPDIVVAQVSQTQLSPTEFLQTLLVEFGFKPFRARKVELLSMLKDFMVEQYAAGKKILLVIDEAQNLSNKVLEEIRLLSGLEAQKEKLLRIIIAGQPELASKLDSPSLQQLTQRVRLRFHLGTLSKRETREYITHRLNVAGANNRTIFDEAACDMVFRYTGGVPRLINVLCDTAMLCAFAEELTRIDEGLVNTAADELQWVEYAERMRAQQRHAEYHVEIADDSDDSDDFDESDDLDDSGDSGASREPARPATRSRDSRAQVIPATPAIRPRVSRDSDNLDESDDRLARLEVLFRDEFVVNFNLSLGRIIIGRTAENDLQIRSKFVSRHHAQVVSDSVKSVVEDLNSTNGMLIKAQRVKRHTLADGDVIELGEHKLVYRDLRRASGQADIGNAVDALNADDNANEKEHQDDDEALERSQP